MGTIKPTNENLYTDFTDFFKLREIRVIRVQK
jgi:hypothetical protein